MECAKKSERKSRFVFSSQWTRKETPKCGISPWNSNDGAATSSITNAITRAQIHHWWHLASKPLSKLCFCTQLIALFPGVKEGVKDDQEIYKSICFLGWGNGLCWSLSPGKTNTHLSITFHYSFQSLTPTWPPSHTHTHFGRWGKLAGGWHFRTSVAAAHFFNLSEWCVKMYEWTALTVTIKRMAKARILLSLLLCSHGCCSLSSCNPCLIHTMSFNLCRKGLGILQWHLHVIVEHLGVQAPGSGSMELDLGSRVR